MIHFQNRPGSLRRIFVESMFLPAATVLVLFIGIQRLCSASDCEILPQTKQQEEKEDQKEQKNSDKSWDQEKAFKEFQELLTGATLKGNFTIIGKKQDLTPESYQIESVKKYNEGDYWIFKVRITYGTRDETLTFPLQVKWAGGTPVMTLEKGEIPVLKNYSARVVIDDGKYAGTWSSPGGGGHLFGVIERTKDESEKTEKKKDD